VPRRALLSYRVPRPSQSPIGCAPTAVSPSAARAPHQAGEVSAQGLSGLDRLRDVARAFRALEGRILITGPSGSGKSTLCRYFRERGVNAVDGDEIRGLGGPVDLQGHPLRRITKDQWRRIEDWRHFWNEAVLKRFLARKPTVVLFGASDNMFDLDLAHLFDRRIYLGATWPLIRARLNDPTRDNDWGRDSQPAQRDWVRRANREWPVRAKASGFEFIDAELSPARIFRQVCDTGSETVGTERPPAPRGQSTTPRRRGGPHVSSRK
jgi:GTPase SAR1 family protein